MTTYSTPRLETPETRNEWRLVASEIILRLYEAGDVSQLKLLKMIVDRSLEDLSKESKSKGATA